MVSKVPGSVNTAKKTDTYREYPPPPPEKYEKLSTGYSPPFRPLNVFIHSEVKKNP